MADKDTNVDTRSEEERESEELLREAKANNKHPRKARKRVFKQDDRLKLAFIENREYGRDVFGTIPAGERGRWDLYLLFYYFCSKHPFGVNKGEKTLLEQLEERGYDLSTLYFEIRKTKEDSKKLENGMFDCSEATSLVKGVSREELRYEFYRELADLLDVYKKEELGKYSAPSHNWYKFYESCSEESKILFDELVEDIKKMLMFHYGRGVYRDNDTRKLLAHAERIKIHNYLKEAILRRPDYLMEKFGYTIDNSKKFLEWFSWYYDIPGKHVEEAKTRLAEKMKQEGKEIDFDKVEDYVSDLFFD